MMRMVNTQEDISSSRKAIVMQDIRYYGRTHVSLSNAFKLRRLLQARFNLDCITSLLLFIPALRQTFRFTSFQFSCAFETLS